MVYLFYKNSYLSSNSIATKNALQDIGVTSNKISVIYNGIQIPNINTEIKKKNKFIVGMFSRISHWKGQEYFIEAINLLQKYKEFKNMEFWVVGDAVMGSEEEKYKQKILNLIEKYKLSDNIKMFGFVNNPIEYMKYIDILILPSIYPEPFGRVVVEAMLLKKVVIATNMGGVTEIINHKEDGILVDLENLSYDISQWIIELYNDRNLYEKLSEQGYKKALNNFTEEKMLKQIDECIRNLK